MRRRIVHATGCLLTLLLVPAAATAQDAQLRIIISANPDYQAGSSGSNEPQCVATTVPRLVPVASSGSVTWTIENDTNFPCSYFDAEKVDIDKQAFHRMPVRNKRRMGNRIDGGANGDDKQPMGRRVRVKYRVMYHDDRGRLREAEDPELDIIGDGGLTGTGGTPRPSN